MRELKHINIDVFHAQAKAGNPIHPCLTECLILSAEENRDIKLTHNSTTYLISAQTYINSIVVEGGVKDNGD